VRSIAELPQLVQTGHPHTWEEMIMYLFTRSRRIDDGDFAKAMESVAELTDHGRKITGRRVDAWSAVLSPEVGTIVWSLWADTMAQVIEAGDALVADAGFMKLVEKTDDHFDGPYVDGIAALVHGDVDVEDTSFEYVGVATATAANGRLQQAIAAGIEIADHVKKVTGDNTLFVVNSTGPFGGCAWITPMADSGAVDAGEAALMADADWLPLIDRVGTAFAQDAAQAIYRRIA
jgi:hypothetical protein